jgi:hypothetical protein
LIIPASAKDISMEKSPHFKPGQCALLLIAQAVADTGRKQLMAVLDASGSSFAIGEETSRRRMERAGVWLTSTNTMVAELVGNWATPQGMALVPLLAADPPMLPVY